MDNVWQTATLSTCQPPPFLQLQEEGSFEADKLEPRNETQNSFHSNLLVKVKQCFSFGYFISEKLILGLRIEWLYFDAFMGVAQSVGGWKFQT